MVGSILLLCPTDLELYSVTQAGHKLRVMVQHQLSMCHHDEMPPRCDVCLLSGGMVAFS